MNGMITYGLTDVNLEKIRNYRVRGAVPAVSTSKPYREGPAGCEISCGFAGLWNERKHQAGTIAFGVQGDGMPLSDDTGRNCRNRPRRDYVVQWARRPCG